MKGIKLIAEALKADNDRLKHEIAILRKGAGGTKRTKTLTEIIVNAIETIVPELEPMKLPRYFNSITTVKPFKGEHVLALSDLHYGECVLPEYTAGLTEYNSKIFAERLGVLRDKVALFKKIDSTSHKIDTLNIFILGDIVHGQRGAGKWGAYTIANDTSILMQVFEGAALLSKFIQSLLEDYQNIVVAHVPGNHGRVGKVGDEPTMCNWDIVVMEFVRESLRAETNVKILPKRYDWRPFVIRPVGKMKFMLEHGNVCASWLGLPFYGLSRERARMSAITELTEESFDVLFVGHWHRCAVIPENSGYTLVNGSFVTGDEYSVNRLRAMRTAQQMLLLVAGGKMSSIRMLDIEGGVKAKLEV